MQQGQETAQRENVVLIVGDTTVSGKVKYHPQGWKPKYEGEKEMFPDFDIYDPDLITKLRRNQL